MKKILFVVDERQMGGVSVVLNDLLHFLDYKKYKVDVLVLHNRGEMLQSLPEEVHLFFGTPFFESIDYSLKEVIQKKNGKLLFSKLSVIIGMKTGLIKKRIRKERKKMKLPVYDVEIAFKDGFCAIFTACGNASKKIHWLHCSYKTFNPNKNYPTLFQKVLSSFDRIVGVSPNVVKEFNEMYHLEAKTEVIPIAIDVERIKKRSLQKAQFSLNKKKLHFICIGRMHPVKGYDRFLKVLQSLLKEKLLEEVEVHFYGDGPILSTLMTQADMFGLQDVVSFKGAIANPYAELKNYDMLLLPSYSEAFGMVITESFLLGVPVFATRTAGSEMLVKENENGWICENKEEAIYEGLKALLLDKEKIYSCKETLKTYHYDNDTILKRIEVLLDS